MDLSQVGAAPQAVEPALDPDLPIVDAHHHLYPAGALIPYDIHAFRRDIDTGHRIVATVFVEGLAAYRAEAEPALQPVGETEFVVRDCPLGGGEPQVGAAVVAFADLRAPPIAARTLDAHLEAGEGRLRGVRHNVVWHEREERRPQRHYPPHLLADPAFRDGLREVANRGLSYDVWLLPEQIPELAAAADAIPALSFIANHLGGPVTAQTDAGEAFRSWREALSDLARRPNVSLKISGLGMSGWGFGLERAPARPTSADLARMWAPFVKTAIEIFGAGRCMFASNFPVDKVSVDYDRLWNAFKIVTTNCSLGERQALFAGTAERIYRI